jgi:2-polyprenyl-6-methoxyphenol hydroxylase-like FAD-dependent oxidoreductase
MPTEVVICGAGPTGLLLACELTLAGVEVVVLDRLDARSGQSKALNLQPRSVEILATRDLLEPLLAQAGARIPGGHFAGLPLDYSGLDSRYPYQLGIPQARVEELLARTLAERGVPVRYGSPVVGLDQDESGVDVRIDGAEKSLRADYLVGCDGGSSTVRKLLGVPFVGRDPRVSAVVADVTLADASGAPVSWELPSFAPADGVVVHLIPLGEGVFRLLVAGPEQQVTDRHAPVTQDELARALSHGSGLRLGEIRWASRFNDTNRQAQRYRTGRVLLAGDAAHVHSPTGGQGLNLGLQDAFNLGWKLAAAVRSGAPAGLLDTYHDERHPVAAQVLANTLAQGVLLVPDGDARALRGVVAELLTVPAANRALAGQISGLDLSYPVPGRHPLAGRRMPDVDVVVDGRPTTTARLQCAGDGLLMRSDGVAGVGAVLVRPDGHVAWAVAPGDDDEPGRAEATARWFGSRPVREVRIGRPDGPPGGSNARGPSV